MLQWILIALMLLTCAQVVADRALLARLCIVREDLRRMHAAAAGSSDNVLAFNRSNLPRRCAAFLKEVLAVASSQRRRALMEKVCGASGVHVSACKCVVAFVCCDRPSHMSAEGVLKPMLLM